MTVSVYWNTARCSRFCLLCSFYGAFYGVFKVAYDFEKVSNKRSKSLSVCLSDPHNLSDPSETIEVIIIKPGIVTASDMVRHHVLTILTLTFIQGHACLHHEK